jgi:DNA helicase-2/ATP-dependent DNA helicase PcrA
MIDIDVFGDIDKSKLRLAKPIAGTPPKVNPTDDIAASTTDNPDKLGRMVAFDQADELYKTLSAIAQHQTKAKYFVQPNKN